MRTVVKWVGLGLASLAAVGLLAVLALWRSVPPTSGTDALAGLEQPVSVVRDAEAVPHIEAETQADAAMALGYIHAQERLWQMEVLRRTAQGRLAEVFGGAAADTDVFLRTLGMARAAELSYPSLAPRTRAVLEAYAKGVNAWMNRDLRRLEPRLPPEFMAFGYTPEAWQPHHSGALMKLMSLQLSQNMSHELRRLVFAAQGLTSAEIADLMPEHPDDPPAPLPDLRELLPLRSDATVLVASSSFDARVKAGTWASNNWVVAGSRTASGKPLLANDPHLSFGAPSLWYLAHLSYPGADGERTDVIGATLPGTPSVLLGRNGHVAWGFTNAGADVQDLFVERLRPADQKQYLTPNGWARFDEREEVVRLANGDERRFTVLTGRHGVVLPDLMPIGPRLRFSDIFTPLHVVSLNWTGLADDDTTLDAMIAVGDARSVGALRETFTAVRSPMQAIVMADTAGNIQLTTPADVPVRKAANLVQGRAPVPGWDATYDWQRVVPAREIAPVDASPAGTIATANTRLPNAETLFVTRDWDEPQRLDRAEALLAARETHDMASMIAIQNDARSEGLLVVRDLLAPALREDDPLAKELREWNGDMSAEARAPLLMVAWLRALTTRIFEDDLRDAFPRFEDIRLHALNRALRTGGARDWCDDRRTEVRETCETVARDAWDDALKDLGARYGNAQTWTWGRAHPVTGAHQPFGRIAILAPLFNVERPASGGSHTLNRGKTSIGADDPYRSTHGAGYKAVYDLADPENSLFIQNSGQSGHFLSPQYRAQVGRWAKGEYLPMVTDPATYREGALGTWVFTPGP